jgi:hypothetical protein
LSPRQVWRGEYTCAQGRTGRTLTITAVADQQVTAVFAFHHPTTGADSQFEMHGTYVASARRLVLRPGRWLASNARYVSVGMDGRPGADGATFSGTITDPACTTFNLRLR